MKHQCVLFSGLVTSGIVILLFLAGCGGGTASTGAGGNPVPTITAISPTSAVAGSAAGFTLTINGANFVAASTINFGRRKRPKTAHISELKEAADRLASALADVDEEELVAEFKELRRRGKGVSR